MRLSHTFVSAISIVVLAAFQTSAGDLPGAVGRVAAPLAGVPVLKPGAPITQAAPAAVTIVPEITGNAAVIAETGAVVATNSPNGATALNGQVGAQIQIGCGGQLQGNATVQGNAGILQNVLPSANVRPDAAANAAANITGDNRPDQWRYRWENNRWWYWTPQDRWMVYNDQHGWVYPEAIGGCTTGRGGATVAPQIVVPGNLRSFGPGRSYNPRLGAFDYSPGDLRF